MKGTKDGQKLLRIMERLKITQQELADMVGTDQSRISKYIKGTLKVPPSVIKKLHYEVKLNFNWWHADVAPMFLDELNKKSLLSDISDLIVTQSMILSQLDAMGDKLQKLATDFYALKHGVK